MMENNKQIDRELGWDDAIESDYDSSFVLLPEGDYDFEVTAFERGRHPGSEKLPACNKAIITLEVGGDQAAGQIRHNLFLHTKTEGRLCAFFTAIGQRKHGERLQMNWNTVVGSTGRCKVVIRKWVNSKTGEPMESNEIKKFYEPEESAPRPTPGKSYQEGMF